MPTAYRACPPEYSGEQLPVQRSVLNCFQNVIRADVWRTAKVGEGASDFEDAVVGAGRKVHLLPRVLQVIVAFFIQLAVQPDKAGDRDPPFFEVLDLTSTPLRHLLRELGVNKIVNPLQNH